MRLLSRERRSSRALSWSFFPICEIAGSRGVDDIICNRGISGLNTDEFLQHIHPLLLDLQPSKVFINIGTNDMTEEPYGDQSVVPTYDSKYQPNSGANTSYIAKYQDFTSWLFTQPIFICLGRPRLQFSG